MLQIQIAELTKRYYTISEVAVMFDVSKSLIRYWEQEFEVLKPSKTASGERKFTPSDIELFQKIYQLVKVRGFTLNGAKVELQKEKKERREKKALLKTLKNIRQMLLKIRNEQCE